MAVLGWLEGLAATAAAEEDAGWSCPGIVLPVGAPK